MSSKFIPLYLNLIPSTSCLNSLLEELFETLALHKSRAYRHSSKQIETRRLALNLIVCSLLKGTEMVNGRFCSRTIEPNSFTGIGFSRAVFDAVIERLEQHGYIKFQRGKVTPQERFLSRFFIKLKLINFFKQNNINIENLDDNLRRYIPKDIIAKPYVEVRTGSYRLLGTGKKFKGKLVSNHIFRDNEMFLSQMLKMEELNNFLFDFEFKLPNGGAFNGLRRIFNNFNHKNYELNHGGRLYGNYEDDYQRLPKKQRSKITINNEPTSEVDIHGSFLTIAHYLRGIPFSKTNDLYGIDGVHRDIAKSWINLTLTNSKPLEKWPSKSKADLIDDGHKLQAASHYIASIINHYPFLATMRKEEHGWGTLQYIESNIIFNTMLELKEIGIPSFPVHDSLIVKETDRMTCMGLLENQFAKVTGINPIIK